MFLYKDGKAPRIFYARDGRILRSARDADL